MTGVQGFLMSLHSGQAQSSPKQILDTTLGGTLEIKFNHQTFILEIT